jgi:hypothetical protein
MTASHRLDTQPPLTSSFSVPLPWPPSQRFGWPSLALCLSPKSLAGGWRLPSAVTTLWQGAGSADLPTARAPSLLFSQALGYVGMIARCKLDLLHAIKLAGQLTNRQRTRPVRVLSVLKHIQTSLTSFEPDCLQNAGYNKTYNEF